MLKPWHVSFEQGFETGSLKDSDFTHLSQFPQSEVRLGLPDVAKGALEEAVTIRQKSPSDLWELAEARERLGETLLKQGSVGASALLKQAAHDLEVELGADHPQTLRARAALTRT